MAIDSLYWSTGLVLNMEGADTSTTITDISPTPKTPTVNGNAQIDTGQFKTGSSSLQLDGTDDYIEYAQHADFDFGTGDFCIELWWRPTGAATDYSLVVYGTPAGTTDPNLCFGITHFGSGLAGKVRAFIAAPTDVHVDSDAALSAGTWYHIEFSRTSGVIYLFIDGVRQTGFTAAAGSINTIATRSLRLGQYATGTKRNANGWIDGVRLTKGAGRHTATFTTSTGLYEASAAQTATLAKTVPTMTLSATSGDRLTSTIPTPALSAKVGALVSTTFPMPTFFASAHNSSGENSADLTVPMPALTARTGSKLSAAVPMPALAATVTTTVMMTIRATVPMATLAARSTATGSISLAAAVPMATVSARGGARIAGSVPVATVVSSVTTGSVMTLRTVVPMATLAAAMTSGGTMDFALTVPMPVVGPWGRMVAVAPMAQIEFVAHTVVVVTYEAYCINLQPSAGYRESSVHEVTRFDPWEFDHVIRWRNRYYGVKANGLYLLGGDLDGADPIAWTMHTGISNLGSRQMKVARELFVHGRVGPGLTAQASIGEAADQSYDAIVQAGDNAQATRAKLGRGLKAVYWSFGLADPDGGPADIDALQLEAAELQRKVF